MATTTSTGQPSPLLFFETVNAYQRTEALKTAIELDLFTAIGAGATTASAAAAQCGASERGTRILCDYLTVLGILTKNGERYGLTADSAMFLDKRSPAYLGTAVRFLTHPLLTDGFKSLTAAVRKGGTAMNGEGTMAPEYPVWVEFARGMAPMMRMSAEFIAGLVNAKGGEKWKVLDIAAGHGLFGITIARHNPAAEIVAVDWANVLEVARENAQGAGVSDRYRTIPGSAFEVNFGAGYDIVLLTNFLHHFDPATNEKLLRKVNAALKPGGRAVTLEFVPNADRISPPMSAMFSLIMLGSTAQGDAFTFAELDGMFRNAGFSKSKQHPLPPGDPSVIISLK